MSGPFESIPNESTKRLEVSMRRAKKGLSSDWWLSATFLHHFAESSKQPWWEQRGTHQLPCDQSQECQGAEEKTAGPWLAQPGTQLTQPAALGAASCYSNKASSELPRRQSPDNILIFNNSSPLSHSAWCLISWLLFTLDQQLIC